MKKITCVTTMNEPYYNNIGRGMIESFIKFWPADIELVVYQEGFQLPNYERVRTEDWFEHCFKNWEIFNTKIKGPATRFAKKGFVFLDAMKRIDTDILIWVDADLLTGKPFPRSKIESILPENKMIAFFDTYYQVNPNYTLEQYLDKSRVLTACESGLVVMNKRHKNFEQYTKNYETNYTLPERPMHLGDWFDTNVLTGSLIDFRDQVEDLSKLRTTNKTQTPLNKCWLSEYVNHRKAGSKDNFDYEKFKKEVGL